MDLSGGWGDDGRGELLQLDVAGGDYDYWLRFGGEHGTGGVHDLSGSTGVGWEGECGGR